jgi:hypothetical protein
MKKDINFALQKLAQVRDIVPSSDALNFFNKLTDAYREGMITEREIKKIDAQKEIVIRVITESIVYIIVFLIEYLMNGKRASTNHLRLLIKELRKKTMI